MAWPLLPFGAVRPRRRCRRWAAAVGIAVAVVAVVIAVGVDEPLRGRLEAKLNAALDGYSVRLGGADFHPLGFALDLEDLVIVQDANPDPPVAHIVRATASVQWRELLRGAVVADFTIDRPTINLNREQERHGTISSVPTGSST